MACPISLPPLPYFLDIVRIAIRPLSLVYSYGKILENYQDRRQKSTYENERKA
jgi:hypothetical protein